ncbi:hypothetical protein QJS10_CPB13g01426 [Acorus calamus]|uniref:Complex III subunit VI n=1 Tax=Acorus calamus TaxID=4465 RepID=A0AAV9DH33_ACOCL|nr:hypothetical protein QJS10_CPB13g01426 [Acorus calamus]
MQDDPCPRSKLMDNELFCFGNACPELVSMGADEEPVDPKAYLEELCKPKCVKPLLEYRACEKRIEGDETGHKHCTGQYFDYWSCVDKCFGDSGLEGVFFFLRNADSSMEGEFGL